MPKDITLLSVLLSYPGDAVEAAEELESYLKGTWNNTVGRVGHYRIEVERWLSPDDTPEGYFDGGRQGAIIDRLLRDVDIVIALFVNKLGNSTWFDPKTGNTYTSGTVTEVERGRAAGKVVRIFPAASEYKPNLSADPGPPYADPGEWRGPELRERRLQEKLAVWASQTPGNGFYPLEWGSITHLQGLVGKAISEDLDSRRLGMPSMAAFVDACGASVRQTTDTIGKYRGELFVSRKAADRHFVDFMASDKPALVLAGAAGMGKTNQLCHMALERSGVAPTLLLRGAAIPSEQLGVWDEVLSVLRESELPEACRERLRRAEARGLPELLHAWMTAWDTELVIHIDGINENRNIAALGECLGRAARTAANSRIRLFMTCRDVDWHLFESEPVLAGQLYNPPDTGSGTSRRILMEQFTDEEYRQAWPKYKKFYQLKGSPEKDLERLCHDPLMLRFLGEALEETKEIPPGANRDDIFKKYVDNTFRNEKAHLWPLVRKLARQVYDDRGITDAAEITADQAADAVRGAENLQMISSLNIVVDRRQRRSGQHTINFKYDAFFEYVLAQALINEWKWAGSIPLATDQLRGFIGDSRGYRFLQGCLLYLLRFLLACESCEGWKAADAILKDAARGHDPAVAPGSPVSDAEQVRWKTFFCGFVMTDLDTAHEFLDDVVALADDANTVVRWSAGLALGTMSVPEADLAKANEALMGLEDSRNWRGRETAAVALRQFYQAFDTLTPRLEPLADDINWRVRRQAGNTLGDLCLLNGDRATALLALWAKADNWRLRRAVVQARAGLMSDPAFAMEVLEQMVTDPREEIRWRSINVLAYLVKPHRAYVDPTLALFTHLAKEDESVWVRRHVAYWLPDLHHVANAKQRATAFGAIAEAVVRDPHEHVRWAAARALGGFVAGEQGAATEWLEVLQDAPGDNDRVGFAIRYSKAQIALSLTPRRRRQPTTVRAHMDAEEPASKPQAKIEELARSLRAPQLPEMLNADLCKNDRYTNIQDAIKAALVNDDDNQLGVFFDLLRHDEDEGLRWGAASALARQDRIRGPQLDKAVLDFSGDYQYWVRRECLTALANLIERDGFAPSPELLSQILTSTKDPEAEVRSGSLNCLRALQETVASGAADEDRRATIAAAIDALAHDPDRQVAQSAMEPQIQRT